MSTVKSFLFACACSRWSRDSTGFRAECRVSDKMANGQQYSYNEASEILSEIYKIKLSLQSGKLSL